MPKVLTKREFITKANRIHENKFDYTKVNYKNQRTEVYIICKEHGGFYQLPRVHLRGNACQTCSGTLRKTNEIFIREAYKAHGDVYDYSKVQYINRRTNVEIICHKHGPFMQRPDVHIQRKHGCDKCGKSGYSKISIQFLNDLSKEWKVEIQHAENKGEYRIDDPEFKCYYKADGYFERDNKKYVVEFHGDYFHANPLIYKPGGICKLRRMRFDEIYNKTMERMHRIKALGYKVIYIWERDYKQYLYDRDNEFFFEGLLDYYKLL